ncbi:MAG TPA: flavin reductase family protein [bacterium]
MDAQVKKTVLRKIPHGLFVVGVRHDGRVNAFTATWVTQASFTPPRVVLGVRKDSGSFEMIKASRVFTVNVLGKDQRALAERFVKPARVAGDKLEGVPSRPGRTGAPILEDAIGHFECEVREIANEDGDHAVVIGEVVDAGLREDAAALTLADTGWHYGG